MSAAHSNGRKDANCEQILRLLQKKYMPRHPGAEIAVYRHNSASVRIRILDTEFAGMDIPEREDMVWKVLDELPDPVVQDISVLLLLPPEARESSLLSLEFDAPSRSRL